MFLSCSHGYVSCTFHTPSIVVYGRPCVFTYSHRIRPIRSHDRSSSTIAYTSVSSFFFFFSVWFIRWLVCAPFNHYYFHWLLAGWGCWCLMHIHMMTFVYTTIYIVSAHSKGHSPIFISILFFFINAYFSGSLFISFWSAASLASLFHAQRGIGPQSRWCLPKYKAHTSMNPWKPDTRLVS